MKQKNERILSTILHFYKGKLLIVYHFYERMGLVVVPHLYLSRKVDTDNLFHLFVSALRHHHPTKTQKVRKDYNLWPAGKTLYTADLAVREGGIIILVSPLTEGIGEHDEFKQLLTCSYEQIEERIREGASPDIIGASAALAISLVRKRAELWLVSDGYRIRRHSRWASGDSQIYRKRLIRLLPEPPSLLKYFLSMTPPRSFSP